MTVIVGAAALAIDVGNWLATRHKAQVTADAMALAAANYMASNPSAQPSSGDQVGTASSYTQGSGLNPSSATVDVEPSSGTATAMVTTSGSISFASALGIGSPTIKATAVATYEEGTAPYSLFAAGTCSGSYIGSISLNLNGNVTVSGVHSNGDLTGQVGNNTTLNTLSAGCTNSLQDGNSAHAPLVPSVPSPTTVAWPVPFDSPSCQLPNNGPSCYFDTNASDLSTTCTYVAGGAVPSSLAPLFASHVITTDGTNITLNGSVQLSSATVLCAPNGWIALKGNNMTFYGTLYAQTVTVTGNSPTIIPPSDELGIYVSATGGTLDLDPSNGGGTGSNSVNLDGAFVYAPNETVHLGGNNGSGMIEAQSISVTGNSWSFVGTGPTDPYVYGDRLVQ